MKSKLKKVGEIELRAEFNAFYGKVIWQTGKTWDKTLKKLSDYLIKRTFRPEPTAEGQTLKLGIFVKEIK